MRKAFVAELRDCLHLLLVADLVEVITSIATVVGAASGAALFAAAGRGGTGTAQEAITAIGRGSWLATARS